MPLSLSLEVSRESGAGSLYSSCSPFRQYLTFFFALGLRVEVSLPQNVKEDNAFCVFLETHRFRVVRRYVVLRCSAQHLPSPSSWQPRRETHRVCAAGVESATGR